MIQFKKLMHTVHYMSIGLKNSLCIEYITSSPSILMMAKIIHMTTIRLATSSLFLLYTIGNVRSTLEYPVAKDKSSKKESSCNRKCEVQSKVMTN